MFGRIRKIRFVTLAASALLVLAMSACATSDESDVVVATPHAITITTIRFAEPTEMARAHCAKFHRKAVARGGIRLGYKTMWGYDCVDP